VQNTVYKQDCSLKNKGQRGLGWWRQPSIGREKLGTWTSARRKPGNSVKGNKKDSLRGYAVVSANRHPESHSPAFRLRRSLSCIFSFFRVYLILFFPFEAGSAYISKLVINTKLSWGESTDCLKQESIWIWNFRKLHHSYQTPLFL
jgi:hypothetical protein